MSWKKWTGWILGVLTALIVIGAVGGYSYLKSSAFQRYALRKIIESADRSTGGRTQIRALDFDLSTLTAHLYGVVVRGKESADAPALLTIDKLTVGLKIRSLLRRQISLSELLIEHPVAHLQVDRNGASNIPQPPPSDSSNQTSVFDLAVGHVGLSNGEINYNDRKTPLEADLHDLTTDVRFVSQLSGYRGSISYANGHVRYDRYAPLPHRLAASFTATPSGLKLDSATIRIASSSIELAADMTNYSDPVVEASYDVRVHSQDFANLASGVNLAGDIELKGSLHYQNIPNQPFLRNLRTVGEISSDALVGLVSGARLEAGKLHGKYQLADGALHANGVEAQSLGGSFTANLDIEHLDATPATRLRAVLRSISLTAAQRAFRRPELSPVVILGTLDGTAEVAWTGSISNAHAQVDLAVRSSEGRKSPGASFRSLPVEGAVHAIYDGRRNTLSVHQTTLRIPSTTVTAEGQVSRNSHLQISANIKDLHGLIALVSAFRPASAAPPAISGSATMEATVQGEILRPQLSARLSAHDLQVQGSAWKNVDLALQAEPSRAVISNGRLINAHSGEANFDATVALNNWSYIASSPIEAHVSVRQMQIADLQQLAGVRYPVSGDLAAKISLSGSQLDPRGSGSIEIANARAYDEPLKNAALNFHGENGAVTADLQVAADAGAAHATVSYTPKTKAYTVRLDAPALVLEKLRSVQETNLPLQGTLALTAEGRGTLDDPQFSATLQLPKLQVQEKSIGAVKADIRVANRRADLTVDSEVAQAWVRARGHVDLTGDYQADANIDTSQVPLQVLLATLSSGAPQGFSGQTEIHATLKGPLKDMSKLEAHLVIPTLNANYQALQIGADGPVHADYAHSVITLQPAEIRGTGTSLRVQGSVPFGGTTAPTLTAQGSIDAHIFRMFSPDLKSSGTIALDLRATGSAANPQVTGQLKLQDLAFSTPAAPLGVDKLNGTLDIDGERIQISSFTGQVGGGSISAGGSITYRPKRQFNIALQAKSIRLRYPDGLRSVLDGNLTWAGNTDSSTLNGRVLVDALSFTPDFDVATFSDQFSGNAAIPTAPGFADTINLQVAVQSKENLAASSSQISLEGTASLNIGGTVADPVVTGRTDLTSGELFYRNVRYQLQRGIITLTDPNQTRPTLDVSVTTTVEQYNLTLNLRGPFDTLTTSYSSDPPLATADIINLIARGKTSSELAASQSTDSMIASQAASQFSGGVQKLAGISSLEIDPMFGGNNQNPSARVAVQQRVTKNFLFTFSTDVSQPGNEIVQGDYQINKRWSVSVARDQLGGVAVDGRFHTKF
jgi:translocation and assembly module TamB